MSITFEYSFNSPLDLPELTEAVNRVLGTSFAHGQSDAFHCNFLGLPFTLERHESENDRDLNFNDYQYQLWNKTWDGGTLRSIQVEVLILAAFVLQNSLGINDGLLSYDCQRVLARYAIVDGQWCDITTGDAVDPTGHIVDVLNRLDGTTASSL